MRKPFIAGNWKMNTDSRSSTDLAEGIASGCSGASGRTDVVVLPPFVYLQTVKRALKASGVAMGAQDLYFSHNGAFTGEISASMLKDTGCTYVLCGHSERRHVIGEDDPLINRKVSAAISGGLLPIVCVGELLDHRKASQTEQVVASQLRGAMAGIGREMAEAVIVAYEPVWAIGTGLTATPQQAQDVHCHIRQLLAGMYGPEIAGDARILYGGSVKPDNAAELLREEDIDGLLVGGASLKVDGFIAIVQAAKQAINQQE